MTSIQVNVDNFARAETHRMFADLQRDAGGVNRLFHNRAATPIDKQTVIRMNRDTLYSFAVVDISGDATLTLPDPGRRYLSAMVVNEDHYINRVIHEAGTHRLTVAECGSEHVVVAVRTLVDSRDADDLAVVAGLQDLMTIDAARARAFSMPDYEAGSFERTRHALLSLASDMTSFAASFGRREDVDPVRHLVCTAAGWGGLPDAEATYLGVAPNLPAGGAYELTIPPDVPVDGFWSISVYNADGFFEPNPSNAYSVNSVTAVHDDDGGVTVRFGGDGDPARNSIPITDGWNYLVRLYRPRPQVLDGTWTFPALPGSRT